MGDIKLVKLSGSSVTEIDGGTVALERSLQTLFERNLEALIGVRFLARDSKVVVFVKVDPSTITIEPGFTRDVRNIGHYGTGDLEITITSDAHFERAKPLLLQSYEAS